jgi:hypothetical protein
MVAMAGVTPKSCDATWWRGIAIAASWAISPYGANEEAFLWRGADTKTLLNGTAAATRMEF